METSDDAIQNILKPLFDNPALRNVRDIVGEDVFAVFQPLENRAIEKADREKKKTQQQKDRADAAADVARGGPVESIPEQLAAIEPEPVTSVVDTQQQIVIDERGRRRQRRTGGGKQSTILTGTNTRLKQRLGQ